MVARARLWVICDTRHEDGYLIQALRPIAGPQEDHVQRILQRRFPME